MKGQSHSHHSPDVDWATMVALTEQEAEVLFAFLSHAMSLLADLATNSGLPVRRILDVGSGPGVGTCALADTFTQATVLAVDGSAEMLASVTSRATRLGVVDRVATQLVDLHEGMANLGTADLVWASMVVHHVGNEAAALRQIRSCLEPGGLFAMVEFGEPLRLLPEGVNLGRPGLWGRLDAARRAWLADMRAGLPGATSSDDYPAMLEAAGFDVVVDTVVGVDLPPPLDDRARAVALGHLRRLREHVERFGDPADLDVLDVLTNENDPDGMARRPDAFFRASRRLLVSRARGGTE